MFGHRLDVLEGEYKYTSDISSIIRNGKRLHEGIGSRKTRLDSLNTKLYFDEESCRKTVTSLENDKLFLDSMVSLMGKLNDIDHLVNG